jgi:hypothetical protein
MINPIVIENVGDNDAPYWVATTHCSFFLAKGNDKLAVIRAANAKYEELQAKKVFTPTTPNFENSDMAYLCRIGLGEINFC